MRKESIERQAEFDRKIAIEDVYLQRYAEYKRAHGEHVQAQPEETWCDYDAYMQSGATESIVEVKVRINNTTAQIDGWGGAILEASKMYGIIRELEKKGLEFDSFYYFNFFKDALRIYHIPLDPYMFSWYSKLLQKDDYTKKKIIKQVTNLDSTYLVEEVKI